MLKKKLTALTLSTLLLIPMLAACGSDTPSSDSSSSDDTTLSTDSDTATDGPSGTVSVFHREPPEADGSDPTNNVWALVQETYPDLDLQVDYVSSDMYDVQLTVRMASSDAPDIFATWPGGRVATYVESGAVMDLTDLWEEEGWFDDYIPAVVSGCTHSDGNIYVAPTSVKPNVFYYNTEVWTNAGVTEIPTDWDSFLDACEAVKETGVTPIVLGTQDAMWPIAF